MLFRMYLWRYSSSFSPAHDHNYDIRSISPNISCINIFMIYNKSTLSALGLLQACLNKSSEANLLRLHTKSARGPISSSSILGILVLDFLRSTLKISHWSIYNVKRKSGASSLTIHSLVTSQKYFIVNSCKT